MIPVEMFPNTVSSASLPWSLWFLFLLTPIAQMTSMAAMSETPGPSTTTLLFDAGAPGHNLRNCSCPAPIQDCNEALANSLCRCHTVLRSSLPPAGLRESGLLAVWLKELLFLGELLNQSTIGHLQLSFCGIKPMDSQYLAVLGLQMLRIHSTAPGALYPDQEITVTPSKELAKELDSSSLNFSSSLHVTFLDVAVLNGLSSLKSYSVIGPPAHTVAQNFPHLALPQALPSSDSPSEAVDDEAAEPPQNLIVTFVY